MIRPPAIVLLFAVMTLCACAEAVSAKNARERQPAAHRSVASGQAVLRKKPPVARTQDEKNWIDRASATSSSGGSGM